MIYAWKVRRQEAQTAPVAGRSGGLQDFVAASPDESKSCSSRLLMNSGRRRRCTLLLWVFLPESPAC